MRATRDDSATSSFHTASEDVTSPRALELVLPATSPGVCPHPYLIPLSEEERDRCVLPGRTDIASHYMATGGRYGAKEPVDVLANNLQSFQR